MKDEERNPLDDLFRKKLDGEQLPPDDTLWGEIEERMDEGKNRRWLPLIFLFIGGLLLTSGIITYTLLHNNSVTKNNIKGPVTENTAAAKNSTRVQTGTNPSVSARKNNSIDSVQKANSVTIAPSSSSAAGSYTSRSPLQKAMPSSLIGNDNLMPGMLQETPETNSATAPSPNGQAVISSSQPNNTTTTATPVNETPPSATTTNEITKTDSTLTKNTSASPSQKVVTDTIATTETPIDTVSKTLNPSPVKQEKTDVVRKDTVAIPPFAKKSHVRWYAEAGADLMDISKTIKANSSADPYYLEKRDAEESAITTFNYIAKVGAQINHLQLEGGFMLYRVGEDVQYSNRAICYNLVSAGYYKGTTYIYKYDTINYHLEKNDSVTRKNGRSVNTYIGIPLQALYSFTIKGIKFQAGAGLATLLPAQWNSWYINTKATALEDPSTIKMINPILLDANINAGVVIPLTDFFDAVATLEYRRNLNSVFKSAYGVQQGYIGVGGGLGIRYTFGGRP